MISFPLRGALAVALSFASVSLARAHATLAVTEAQPNASFRGIVQINHGCAGQPTVSVKVTIPEGVVGARPMPKPGWTLTTVKGTYARSYSAGHGTLTEGVKEITWAGGALPDDQFDEFVFVARVTDAFRPGETVYFPIDQDCRNGGYHWAQIPAAGQEAHMLKEPAPGVRILAAAAGAPPVIKAGMLAIEQPWLRATPGGAKVAGGYVRVTNNGSAPDRRVGASIPMSAGAEVHEMTTQNGIVRMGPVAGGLVIAPGASVELKPGGYHLMFMDMAAPLKEGDTVKGTLVFEKAGTVEVTFPVGGLGAQGPGAQGASAQPAGGMPHMH